MAASLVVHVDGVQGRTLQFRGNQDNGHAWSQCRNYLLAVRAQHRPCDDQTLNTALEHELEICVLVRGGIFLDAPNDQVEPVAAAFRFRAGYELAEKVFPDVSLDYADCLRTVGGQAAAASVGNQVRLLNPAYHTFTAFLLNLALP